MHIGFPGAPRALPTSYLFVDGGNFWKLLEGFSQTYHDGSRLAVNWNSVRSAHRKVYFYDAVPVQSEAEDDNTYGARIAHKLAELSEIERSPGFHVRSGDVRNGGKRRGNEQKMVDVQLAVDALQMGSRGLFETATFLTGDLDFKPLLDALVNLGADVHLLYPPGLTNEKLIAAADRADATGPNQILAWLDTTRSAVDLPGAVHNLKQDMALLRPNAIKVWTDAKYGECVILLTADNTNVKLVTERSMTNPLTHNLEITASTLAALLVYSAEAFDLQIPQ